MAGVALFNRKYRLTVGPPGGTGKVWTDLDCSFQVKKTSDSTPNELNISIYNLNDDSRSFLKKKGLSITLEAGYDENFGLIFKGSTEKATISRELVDNVTTIESKDGIKAIRSTIISESFAPGTELKTTVNKIAENMGLAIGTIKGLPAIKFNGGRSLYGPAKKELETICRSYGLSWAVHDEILYIFPVAASINDNAVLLNSKSGLVGVPEPTEDGCKARSLMRSDIIPSTLIRLESKDLTGNYKVKNLVHDGVYQVGNWYTDLELVAI